jgi:hypothetical protein
VEPGPHVLPRRSDGALLDARIACVNSVFGCRSVRRWRPRRSAAIMVATAAAALLLPGGCAAFASGPAACPAALGLCRVSGGDQVVSNEQTFTTWANPLGDGAFVRTVPSRAAAALDALHMTTSDGLPEVYVVLRLRSVPTGRSSAETWAEIRLPTRRAGETGWVPRGALGDFNQVTTQLVVDRAADRLWLLADGKVIFTAPVGIGRRSSPTPAGHFWIREGFPVVASARAAYGPYALGTSAYSVFPGWPGGGVIGIHGTSHPVVGPSTFGCVTLRDDEDLRLAGLVSIGTPVWVK